MGTLDDLMGYAQKFLDNRYQQVMQQNESFQKNPLGHLMGDTMLAMSTLPVGARMPRPQPSMNELWPGMNLAGKSARDVFGKVESTSRANAEARAIARAVSEPTMDELWPGMNLQGKSAKDVFGK